MEKRDLSRTILKGLLISGAITIAATSPYFFSRALPKLLKYARYKDKMRGKKLYNAFYYLKSKDLIKFKNVNGQIYISLTQGGKKLAGKYHKIDTLKIKKPRRWDKKWRILIFDISEKHKAKREALRGKLKELGLYQLQKSVWVCPYKFKKEIQALRDFFDFKKGEIIVIIASSIESDQKIRNFFEL